jgi:predicted ATP-grasp superfamily ATP-dependent carboligase
MYRFYSGKLRLEFYVANTQGVRLNNRIFSGRTLVVGFEGWSDSGEAASGAVRFMALQADADVVYSVDSEEYYDFQYSRPTVSLDEDGARQLTWPGTEFFAPNPDHLSAASNEQLYFLVGAEPSRNWKAFVSEVTEWVLEQGIESVIFLGSIPADTPHTRPIHIVANSQNAMVRNQHGAEKSNYQGPVGIQTVLALEFEKNGIPTMALWASVPHYVQNGPSPKATLALVSELEKYTGVSFEQTELASDAFTWERNIDELAESDEEMQGYIQQLEESRDSADTESISGDEIALEFERFLATQNENGGSKAEPSTSEGTEENQ